VRELVNEDQGGPPLARGIEIELTQDPIDVDDRLARQNLKALQQRLGLLAAVRFDDADNDIHALFELGTRRLQHLIGLADTGSGTDEDLQTADAALFFASDLGQQGLGRGSMFRLSPLICHWSIWLERFRVAD